MNYLIILLFAWNTLGATDLALKDSNANKALLKKRRAGLTSRVTHKRLERAFRYQRNKDTKRAIKELVSLLKQTKNRKYEFALVWQNLGFMLAGEGESKKAIKALTNSLKLNVLPYGPTLSSLYTVAQLHFAEENLNQAYDYLTEWFAYADKPTAQAYMLMGMILGKQDKKEEALDYVNQAINMEKDPQEKWLQFALSLNHSLKRYKNAIKILITLTSQYPEKKRYWKQTYQTYLSLHDDKKALAIMEMAYKQGHIVEEKEIMNMASLMVFMKMPYKAASLVESEILKQNIKGSKENYEFLSQAWYQARETEKALDALEKAGSQSIDGQIFAKKGFMLLESDKFDEAVASFEKSLKKGKLKDESKVRFALGLAHFNKKDLAKALDVLEEAKKMDKENTSIVSLIDQIKMKKMQMNELGLSL